MKRRGLHHPLTRDSILLRVNAIQKAQCTDEVSINMECNARLRDSWGPRISQGPLHSELQAPKLGPQTPISDGHHRRAKTCGPILKRAVSQNVANTSRGRAQPHSADTHGAVRRVSGFTTRATEGLPNPECTMKTSTSLPRISSAGPVREQGGFRLLPVTQLEDKSCEYKLSRRDTKQEKTLRRRSHVH